MCYNERMTTATATDWADLEQGRGWTPGKVSQLRATLNLNREAFGKLLGTGERSVYRWETGAVKTMTVMSGRALAQLAKDRLNPGQLVELCQTE